MRVLGQVVTLAQSVSQKQTHVNTSPSVRRRLPRLLRSAALGLSIVLSTGCSGLWADELFDRVRFSGFGTLAWTHGGDDALGFRRHLEQEGEFGNGSFKADSVLGLQMDADLTDDVRATLQLVGKDRPRNGLEESVEAAYLAYRINPRWTLRAGRLGIDLLPMSEYQHIGFAYDRVRPPVDYYGAIPITRMDGVDLRYALPVGPGTLSTKLYLGVTENTYEASVATMTSSWTRFTASRCAMS